MKNGPGRAALSMREAALMETVKRGYMPEDGAEFGSRAAGRLNAAP